MSFPRYEQYKDSGVDWLGEVPEHWQIFALKRIANLQSGETIGPEAIEPVGQYPVYGGNGLRGFTNTFTHNGNHALIGRQGALCGNVNYASGEFWASEHAIVVTPIQSADTTWLGELLREMNLNQYSIASAQPGLSVDNIRKLLIAVPTLPEQQVIGHFLQHETTKIDALMEEQWRLIGLLKEKRQAIISHAVTKGLNPDASMKDSGVEWLGNVPQHWPVYTLKRALSEVDYGISESLNSEGAVAILRMGNIQDGKVVMDDLKYTDSVDPALILREGDLLYNRTNSLDLIGKVGMYTGVHPQPVSFASYLVRLRMVAASQPTYFAYLLNTEGILAIARSNAFVAIGQCNLNPTRYAQILIALPPRQEQDEIAKYLDERTFELDLLKCEAEVVIQLLQERRSALISAAVTGKIDVRNYTPKEAA
jgi:type I restriction enzyme, S subunit